MAFSSSPSQASIPAATAASPFSHLPCIRALHLNPPTASAVLSVSEAVKHDQEASGQHLILAAKTLGESKTWSSLVISSESWAKVSALRTALIGDSDSVTPTTPNFLPPSSSPQLTPVMQLIPVLTQVNPTALYLYEKAMVVQLHAGVAPLRNFLPMEQDCGLVIPLYSYVSEEEAEEGSLLVTAWDETRDGKEDVVYRLELSIGRKAFVMAGTSKLRVEGPEPLVAVVFCLAAGGDGEG
ncbi:hypothetical protein GE09DRAFT_1057892 [Coniochaeta sp. 2T2.1]|nr:hypothetical protein GE09DRAFT_1057892 [Coniochaeta sp. 2T2.1]